MLSSPALFPDCSATGMCTCPVYMLCDSTLDVCLFGVLVLRCIAAVHLLGEPSNGLLSSETVELLLERLVVSTEGYSVGKLEGVHASLSHAIQSFVRGPVKKSQTDIVEVWILSWISG